MSKYSNSSNTKYYRKHPGLKIFEDVETASYASPSQETKSQFNQAFSQRITQNKKFKPKTYTTQHAESDDDDDVVESTKRYHWAPPEGKIPKVRLPPTILNIIDAHRADPRTKYTSNIEKIRSSTAEIFSLPDAGISVSTPTQKFKFLARGKLSFKLATFPRNKEITPYLLPFVGDWSGITLDSETSIVTTKDFSRSITDKGFSTLTTRCKGNTISLCLKNSDSNIYNLVLFDCPPDIFDTMKTLLRKYCRWRYPKKSLLFNDATKPQKPKRYIANSSYLAIERGQPIMPLQMPCYDIIKVYLASGEVCYIPTSIMKEIEYEDENDWGYDPSKAGTQNSDSDDDTWLTGTKVVDYGKRAAVKKGTKKPILSSSSDDSDDDSEIPPPQHVFEDTGPPPEDQDETESDEESD